MSGQCSVRRGAVLGNIADYSEDFRCCNGELSGRSFYLATEYAEEPAAEYCKMLCPILGLLLGDTVRHNVLQSFGVLYALAFLVVGAALVRRLAVVLRRRMQKRRFTQWLRCW